jgi:hypothetical protein
LFGHQFERPAVEDCQMPAFDGDRSRRAQTAHDLADVNGGQSERVGQMLLA